jgi:hypothetical protein
MNPEQRQPEVRQNETAQNETDRLILNDFRGEDAEVTVERTAKHGNEVFYEGGWQVKDCRNGILTIFSADGKHKKSPSLKKFREWQDEASKKEFKSLQPGQTFGEWLVRKSEGMGDYLVTREKEGGAIEAKVMRKTQLIDAEIERIKTEMIRKLEEKAKMTLGDSVSEDFVDIRVFEEQLHYLENKKKVAAYLGSQLENEPDPDAGHENDAGFHDMSKV